MDPFYLVAWLDWFQISVDLSDDLISVSNDWLGFVNSMHMSARSLGGEIF